MTGKILYGMYRESGAGNAVPWNQLSDLTHNIWNELARKVADYHHGT